MMLSSLPLWAALPAALLLVCGGILTLLGSLGLVRLKDFFARVHAPTMGSTLGTYCVLAASLLARSQTHLKRMIAYSSVSQIGYVFLGISLGTGAGAAMALSSVFVVVNALRLKWLPLEARHV